MKKIFCMPPAAGARRNAASRSALVRVWIETGNPRRPLACFWVDAEMRAFAGADRRSELPADGDSAVPLLRLCA